MNTNNTIVKQVNLSFKPRAWQEKALSLFSSTVRHVVLAVHRRAGKSHLAAIKLITHALRQPGLYAYIMPELKQVKDTVWPVFKHYLEPLSKIEVTSGSYQNLIKVNESELSITFNNGSVIRFFGALNGDSMRGAKFAGVVFDEVAQVPHEVWDQIVSPALMDTKNSWALFIGTPYGINLFSALFDLGQDPNVKDFASMRFTVYETDALDPETVENWKRRTAENTFRREMLCDFSASTENQLLSVENVDAAMQRYIDEGFQRKPFSPEHRASVFLGVDVARFGDDCSVIFVRSSNRAELVNLLRGKDTAALADAVRAAYRKYKPNAIYIDGTGVGGGVVDLVRACNIPCYDINFSSKSSEKIYFNKRAEIWAKMAEWIKRKGAVSPDLRELKIDLPAPLYTQDDQGQMKLEAKKDIKKRIGKSPDLGDALALTFSGMIPEYEIPEESKETIRYLQVKTAPETPIEKYEREINERHKRQPQRFY